jgi:Tfp pilus assembly protein PilN
MTEGAVINLIPTPRLLRKSVRARVRRWAVGLPIYAVALAFGCAVIIRPAPRPIANDDTGVQTHITQLTADFDNANAQLADARVRYAAALSLTAQPDWGNLLSVLGDKLGEEVVLRDVRLTQAKSAAQRQYTLEMRGLARTQASVSIFVAALEEMKLFDQVRLLRTGREPFLSDSVITFDLECSLSDAPARTSAPTTSQGVAGAGAGAGGEQ